MARPTRSHKSPMPPALRMRARWLYLTKVLGMDIHPTARFSLKARFDKGFAPGIHVGERSYVAFDAGVLAFDPEQGAGRHTRIGRNCFIGARSILHPGVEIGDNSIVSAGSVVTKNVPPGSLVAGNPARVLESGLALGPYGYRPAEAEPAAEAGPVSAGAPA